MTTVTLGATPLDLDVKLDAIADFVSGFDSEDGDWPDSAEITLHFNDSADTTWPATIDAAAVDWNVDKADVAALISRFPTHPKAWITYVDGTTDLVWFRGKVSVA